MRTNMAYIGLPPTHDALGDSGRRQTMCRESTEGDETPKGLVPGWIRRGELRAINAATRLGSRPRYLVDVDDLAAFESRRAVTAATKSPRRRPKRLNVDVTEFF